MISRRRAETAFIVINVLAFQLCLAFGVGEWSEDFPIALMLLGLGCLALANAMFQLFGD